MSVAADDQRKGPTIAWLGEAALPSTGSLHLSKAFESADAARAFEGTFVVTLGGTGVGRETVRFADCDPIADLGLDPRLVRGVTVWRSLDSGVLSSDTHSNENAPIGCFLSPPHRGPAQVLFRIPSNDRLTFTYAGKDVLPQSVQLFEGTRVWEVLVDLSSGSVASAAELAIFDDGQPIGAVPASFDPCTKFDSKTVVSEELWLTTPDVDGGHQSVHVDGSGGVFCNNSDGTSAGAIP